MRVQLLAAFWCFALVACSPRLVEPNVVGYVEPYDFGTQTAYEVAEGLDATYIPDTFRTLALPHTSGARRSLYVIVDYKGFKRGEVPSGYHGANASELLAFMGKYGVQIDDYRNLCAPTGFINNSVALMAAVSKVTVISKDGTSRSDVRYGTRMKPGKGCAWALMLKEEPVTDWPFP